VWNPKFRRYARSLASLPGATDSIHYGGITVITDRTEQFERPATARPHPSAQRYTLRRRHVAGAPASVQRPGEDARAEVAWAFRALANGVDPRPAQAQATAFYRSSGQVWARSLGVEGQPRSRAHVAAAFRAMAHGIDPNAAREATLRFYRSSGHDWTRGLSGAA
jgi:hypothetical protein